MVCFRICGVSGGRFRFIVGSYRLSCPGDGEEDFDAIDYEGDFLAGVVGCRFCAREREREQVIRMYVSESKRFSRRETRV